MGPKPAVLVTRRMPSAVLAQLDPVGEIDLHTGSDVLTHEALCARLRGKQGIICVFTDRIDAAVIVAGDQLRVIATVAVGVDNIDVTAAATRGIVVTNTPDVLTGATAELTWALILAVTRRLGEGERVIRRGAWTGWTFDFMLGTELRGKQLGIIGAGRIWTSTNGSRACRRGCCRVKTSVWCRIWAARRARPGLRWPTSPCGTSRRCSAAGRRSHR